MSVESLSAITTETRKRFTVADYKATARRVPEWRIQAACVSALRKTGWDIELAGDMNAGRRGVTAASIAKACGMAAGEPDLRVYGPRGRLLLIEYKAAGGRTSKAQRARHAALAALGHRVTLIQSVDVPGAVCDTLETVRAWLAKGMQ